jgi:hypothetical protein
MDGRAQTTTMVHVRVDEKIQEEASATLAGLGTGPQSSIKRSHRENLARDKAAEIASSEDGWAFWLDRLRKNSGPGRKDVLRG